jgi:threonyl-tRNA synthetase
MGNGMDSVRITLPDGSVKEAPRGTRIGDFVREQIGPGLAKAALAAKLDGKPVDLSRPLEADGGLEVITEKMPEGLEIIRHSAAHILPRRCSGSTRTPRSPSVR